MSKAFTKESDTDDDDDLPEPAGLPVGVKNYITPAGHARLKNELEQLVNKERPKVVETVAWAASNGDRSENGDYIYGKRRLREIDRRIRFLIRRLEKAEIVHPQRQNTEQVFFGATVSVCDQENVEQTIAIVGLDEVDPARGYVSWVSPIAKALLKARVGDVVRLQTPAGIRELEILKIQYQTLT
ncbi:MAG: transcription elongation factor GreB [Gammaproteobacteria bacterium]|nr:transcription elongation factor GreB [Gammaproteobacteria bacterium]